MRSEEGDVAYSSKSSDFCIVVLLKKCKSFDSKMNFLYFR